jgi:hypothetical protein
MRLRRMQFGQNMHLQRGQVERERKREREMKQIGGFDSSTMLARSIRAAAQQQAQDEDDDEDHDDDEDEDDDDDEEEEDDEDDEDHGEEEEDRNGAYLSPQVCSFPLSFLFLCCCLSRCLYLFALCSCVCVLFYVSLFTFRISWLILGSVCSCPLVVKCIRAERDGSVLTLRN